MPQPLLVPPDEWRHLLRAILRQCSYLPDPVARRYMHNHVLHRFRERTWKYLTNKDNYTPQLQVRLRRNAKLLLYLLTRANEGYTKPLERVLLISYGRIGKRRHELLEALLEPPMRESSRYFGDDWRPQSILIDLLKAQKRSAVVFQVGVRPTVNTFEPKIPKENIWGRPMPQCRQRNIRRRWYINALESALPPLVSEDVTTLERLMSRELTWKLPQQRANNAARSCLSQTALTPQFLLRGPSKDHTFKKYEDGRPHRITIRFMQRLWDRINCLIPRRQKTDNKGGRMFYFPMPRRRVDMAVTLDEAKVNGLFEGLDDNGIQLPAPPSATPSINTMKETVP